ncbi:pilin [Actinoplanes sp. CA-131856]
MSRTPRARLRAPNTHFLDIGRRVVRHAAPLGAAALILLTPAAAHADPGVVAVAANSLPQVVANLQIWIMGILAAVATLFLVLAGVYRATAGGDPAQVDKSNAAFKNALVGYGLAVLAPVLLQVVRGIVGG